MKLVNLKALVVTLLTISFLSVSVSATYDAPWLPEWSSETGYTSQFWGLNSVEGEEPAQPLAADIYSYNNYGTATTTWTNDESGFVAWAETMMGSHPSWVNGVYGGMTDYATFDIGATVDTGTEIGSLIVFVQYDWYAYSGADVSASIEGATEITPVSYYDYVIGESGSGNPWYRTTQVFELDSNTGAIEVSFSGSGFATGIDSFSVTTAVDAVVPTQMPIPEPATMALLGISSIIMLHRRK